MISAKFCGFDSGLQPGLAVVQRTPTGYELLFATKIKTDPKAPLGDRCSEIWRVLGAVLREYHPLLLTIEEQMGVQTGKRRQSIETGQAQMNAGNAKTVGTQFLALGCALAYGVPFALRQPQQAKIAVLGKGYGHATKKQVQEAIRRITGLKVNQDAADATALAILGCQRRLEAARPTPAPSAARRSASPVAAAPAPQRQQSADRDSAASGALARGGRALVARGE